MKKEKFLAFGFIATILALLFFGGKYFFFDSQSPTGSLRVDSIPKTKVFLDDTEIGQTPYLGEKLKPGEYRIKLTPNSEVGGSFTSWETKVKVSANTLTYVSRELGFEGSDPAGQQLFLERLGALGVGAEVAVVSDPDGATVVVDGLEKGKAPLLLSDQTAGDHVMTISASGYADQVIRSKFVSGYRLNAIVKLKKLSVAAESVKSTAELIASGSAQMPQATISGSMAVSRPFVTIRDNPLGFLRVRTGPDFGANEIARIYPGEQYPLLSQSEGWVKIKLSGQAGSGWVSDQYVFIYQ